MKNNRASTALALIMLTGATTSMSASAQQAVESPSTVMAAGACQPFAPTSSVRYNASGLSNVGTQMFYVVCSVGASGDAGGAGMYPNASTRQTIVFSNNASAAQTMTCSARPGRVDSSSNDQRVSTRSTTVSAGASSAFMWIPADFSMVTLANANFTCALPPGMTINYIDVLLLDVLAS